MITEEWRVVKTGTTYMVRDAQLPIITGLKEDIANFIVEAHNQAIKINKDNPMAVIKGLGDVVDALKKVLPFVEAMFEEYPYVVPQMIQVINQAISKVEEK